MPFQEAKIIHNLLKSYSGKWMIAGGWAIDLFLNQKTRNHQDIEIAIPRKDQQKIKSQLKDWSFRYVKSGNFEDWGGEELHFPIHEIHGKYKEQEIEILLNEIENEQWKFRRNPDIQYPLEKVIIESKIGIPILCPEIILLYKAKNIREKDQTDFQNVISKLDVNNQIWLRESIRKTYGHDHSWIPTLK